MDSNHRSLRQQIYSLPPLATWVSLHIGAGDGIRTRNLLITNQLLCLIELHQHIKIQTIKSEGMGSRYKVSNAAFRPFPASRFPFLLLVTPRGIEPLLPP